MPRPATGVAPLPADLGRLGPIFRTLRIRQWSKNLLLFAGAIFARRIFHPRQMLLAALAFAAFCLVSSALYVFNDLIDLESDRRHPRKRGRPIASGAVSIPVAVVLSTLLGLGGLGLALALGRSFMGLIALYAALTVAYTLFLKRLVLIDVMVLAVGFVLRAMAGATAVQVEISPWLLVCTMTLALFLALIKRRQEIGANGIGSRQVLAAYSLQFLDQAIAIITAATLMSYFLYTFTSVHSNRMMLTIPFVIYGVFRYLLLAQNQGAGEEPEEVLLGDWPFLINILFWIAASIAVIYLG